MKTLGITAAVVCVLAGACLQSGCSRKSQATPTADADETAAPAARAGDSERIAPLARRGGAPLTRDVAPQAATEPLPAKREPPPAAERAVNQQVAMAAAASQAAKALELAKLPDMDPMRQQFGIEISSVSLNGPAVEVQFFVLDPEKGGQLLAPTTPRYLIDAASGAQIVPPRTYRTARLKMAYSGTGGQRNYIATFDNSAGAIKAGSKVAVVMGEYRVDGITVH